MNLDRCLRSHSVLVVLGLLALTASLQAAGTVKLVGAAMLPDPSVLVASPPVTVSVVPPRPRERSAEAILERNPFDSATGPLTRDPVQDSEGPSALDTPSPLESPRCDAITVSGVTHSSDPSWSFAALKGPGDSSSRLRRPGDRVGEREVAFIGYNGYEGKPSVWLREGSKLCQALLFAPPSPVAGAASSAGGSGGPPPLLARIASKIQKVSATEYNLDRSLIDLVVENQTELMRSVRVVPEKGADGTVIGIRLHGIRPESLLGLIGMKGGDRLDSINGHGVGSPSEALEAYAYLSKASNLRLKLLRGGQRVEIELHVK